MFWLSHPVFLSILQSYQLFCLRVLTLLLPEHLFSCIAGLLILRSQHFFPWEISPDHPAKTTLLYWPVLWNPFVSQAEFIYLLCPSAFKGSCLFCSLLFPQCLAYCNFKIMVTLLVSLSFRNKFKKILDEFFLCLTNKIIGFCPL